MRSTGLINLTGLGALALVAASGHALAAPTPIIPGDPAFPAFVPQPPPMPPTPQMPNPNPERSGLATKAGALQPVWDHELANMVRPLAMAGTQLNFAFGQCFGGGMIDDLLAVGGNNLTATSASRYDEFAYYRRPAGLGGVNRDWVDTYDAAMLPAAQTFERNAYNAFRNDPWGVSPVAARGVERRLETAQWGQIGAAAGTKTLQEQAPADRYAVLYSGQPEAADWEQLAVTYNTLINAYGYNRNNIFLVADAGFASIPAGNPLRNPMTGIPGANGVPATTEDLNALLTVTLGGLGAMDQLFFLANDHGALQTSKMAPGCWMVVPKQDEIDPSAPELPPASPGGYSPPSQYLGSIPTMFDVDPLTSALTVKPSWGQYYVPTPGAATLGALGLLMVARRRAR